MNRLFRLILIAFIFSTPSFMFAQAGMKFAELAKRLEPYYDKELIEDVQKQLPQGDYSIWGWDVGDFSGDGNNDVALSVKVASQKGKTIQVILLVDIDGYLVKVGQLPYEFVEMPLEIGVAIKGNACHITKKNKQFNWIIDGFRYDNGSLMKLDQYKTRRIGGLTYESYNNYVELKNSEKYLQTKNGKEAFYSSFMTIPSYKRGRLIYKGYSAEAVSNDVENVPAGAYFWSGEKDLSFNVSSAYDDEFLYFTIRVADDVVVGQNCDTCISDNADMWLFVDPNSDNKSRFAKVEGEKVTFTEKAESGIFKFSIYPGNFTTKKPTVKVSSSDDMQIFQKTAVRKINVVSDLTPEGYILKFKIPFVLLGLQANPVSAGKPADFGCSVIVHDYDNEFRPEESTDKTMSAFVSDSPSTYSTLTLIPDDMWYGETTNIYQEDILNNLLEYGF